MPICRVRAGGSNCYSRAVEAERDASDEGEELAEALWESPAKTLAGLAAKLHVALVIGEHREGCEESPWPQIRSVLADLLRMDGKTLIAGRG